MIKELLKKKDEEKQVEQFQKYAGQRRLKYAQENSSHLKVKSNYMPASHFKKQFNKEVPEYLLDLVQSGFDIDDLLNMSKKGIDMRTVKKVLRTEQNKSH